jgi:hypothetical protein
MLSKTSRTSKISKSGEVKVEETDMNLLENAQNDG